MTVEERLAVVESQLKTMKDDQTEIKASLKELADIAAMGRGALWLALKIGVFLAGSAAIAKVAFDFFAGRG